MALDLDNIYNALITSLRNSVGSQLSRQQGGGYPSIIRERQDAPRPDLPYVSLDIENIILPSGWILDATPLEDGLISYTILYEVYVAVKCYGDESKTILQQYQSMFCIDSGVRGQLQTDAGLASHKIDTVKHIPDFLQTNHEDRSLLRLSFYAHDTVVTGGIVEKIGGGGLFKENDEIKITSLIEVDASDELNP